MNRPPQPQQPQPPQKTQSRTAPQVSSNVPPENGFSSHQDVSQYHGDREELPPIVADELETSTARLTAAPSKLVNDDEEEDETQSAKN